MTQYIYPRCVFKDVGQHVRQGGTYSFVLANTEEERMTLLSKGWYDTLPLAIEAKSISVKIESSSEVPQACIDDITKEVPIAPWEIDPSIGGKIRRKILESAAQQYNVPYHGNLSDKKLAEKIRSEAGKVI